MGIYTGGWSPPVCEAWVYFACASVGYDFLAVKIGASEKPLARIATLRTGCPGDLWCQSTVRCASLRDARKLERALHAQFSELRMFGEWFRDSRLIWEFVQAHPRAERIAA
jgi:hypothetical protein